MMSILQVDYYSCEKYQQNLVKSLFCSHNKKAATWTAFKTS